MNKKTEKIITATIPFFLRHGIKKITMDEIAENAHVSKVTLYKYFADKDTLYAAVGQHIFAHYMARLEQIPASDAVLIKKLYDYLEVLSDFTDSGQFNLCKELAGYNSTLKADHEQYLQTYRNSMLALIDEGIENGLLKSSLDREIIFHYVDMGVSYYQQNPAYRKKMLENSSFQKQFMQFFIQNIFTDGEEIGSAL